MKAERTHSDVTYKDAVDGRKRFWDLRSVDGRSIRPDAPIIIDAVRSRPNSVAGQLKRIAASLKDAHDTGSAEISNKLEQQTHEDFRGLLAGAILLDLLRLDDAGFIPSLNSASLLLGEVWTWDDDSRALLRGLQVGKHRSWHLSAWREFRPAAHIWATLVLASIQDKSTGAPFSPEISTATDTNQLVKALQIAAGLSVWASRIRLENKKKPGYYPAMTEETTWRFIFPVDYRPTEDWVPKFPILTDAERSILETYNVPKQHKHMK